jgi:hypothetical protein
MKKRWDLNRQMREDFRMGDLILISAEHLPSNRPSRKLDQKWRGPFKVIKKIGESAYELELPVHWKGQRVFNESRIKVFEQPTFRNQLQTPEQPEPELINGEGLEYEV